MQKTKIMCLILAVVLASAGTVTFALNLSGDSETPVLPDNAVDAVMDKPEGESPSDRTAIENLYIAQGELQRKGGFVGTTKGTAVSAGLTQNVYNKRTVIGGSSFKEMITIGIVKNAYQLYMTDNNLLYRKFDKIKSADNITWADTAARYSEEDFLDKFGHRSNKLTGYILNDETIISGALEKEENGLYTYRYVLDVKTAPARMLHEMKTNSNMSGYGTFVKAEIIVTMDSDWQVKTLSTDCKYKVPMFGGIDCAEDCTETFGDLTTDALPETGFFKQFFNADIERPAGEETTALNVLMDMFAPYASGNNLNVSLDATMDGQTVLSGMMSAKIDIENISNIEVAAKLGDDLYIEYQQGSLYVTYQDFKASASVDGIMGVVSALMPSKGGDSGEQSDDILSKFTYKVENGLCTVSLPLAVGNDELNVNIYANVVDGKYEFRNAEVTLGGLRLAIEPISDFSAPARQGDYPEILGLLDIVQNGVIYGNVNAFGMDVDVMFDLAATSLYATSDNLAITYVNETVYAELGAVKAKISIADIKALMSLLRMAGVIELPQISVSELLATLGSIEATATDNGVAFTLTADDLAVAIYLVTTDNGWSLDKLTAEFAGNVITVAATAPTVTEIPAVEDGEYADVYEIISPFIEPIVSIAKSDSYGASFAFTLTIDGNAYNVEGNVAYDSNRNISVAATVSNSVATLIKANVVIADGIVYLDINNIKAAFAANELGGDVDIKQIIQSVYGVNDSIDGIIEAVGGIVYTITNLDLSSIDFVNVIKQFGFRNGTIAVTVNADFVGIGDVDVTLSVGKKGSLVVGLGGLALGNVALDAQAAITGKISAITVPNANDYVLNLAGSVENIEFAVSADLLDMDVSARINAMGQTVLARYVDGKVYAAVGGLAIVATVDQIGALVNEIIAMLGADSVSLDGIPNIDLSVESLLKAITFNFDSATPSIGIDIEGLANVSVNFDSNANFVDITATVMDMPISIVKSDEQVPQLDLNKVYISVEPLAAQVRSLMDADGYSVTLNGSFAFDNHVYTVTADVNYNNGLYVNANVAYNGNNMLDVELWLVDNTLYAQLGDTRLAINVANSAAQGVGGASKLDLGKFRGYNAYVDGILDVVQGVIDKFAAKDVDYPALIGGIGYGNGVLSLTINGEQFGLSQITVQAAVNDAITATISNLAIGSLTANVTASVAASNSAVTAPQGDFTTDLRIKINDENIVYANLDLINNVYNFKLDDMYIRYSDGVIKINKKDIYLSADFDRIMTLVKRVDDLVNEFSGSDKSTAIKLDMSKFKNVDVKAIVNSLTIANVGKGVALGVNLFGYNVNVNLAYGALSSASVYVGLIKKTIEVTPCGKQAYVEFGDDVEYIAIDQVLEDYFPVIERLVHTNSWVFKFDDDALLSIGKDVYQVKAGSYFEFYYKNTEGMDTFKLRAKLNVCKQKADGTWQPYMDIDAVYKDGTIYVTERGRLVDGKQDADRSTIRLKVDVSTLVKCYGLYDRIVAVVPQIGEMVNSMLAAMKEAENNAESISYSTLLTDARYVNGVFGLTLNGGSLLSKLGAIALSAQTYGEGLSLNSLVFTYDTISLNLSNLRVYASEATETDGELQYAAVDDINAYDFAAYHMDFNSLYELLSSFVKTAEPVAGSDGVRTFDLSGSVDVDLSFTGKSGLSVITLDLAARVDITADNITYFTIKISHGNNRIVYRDFGADSYLYFDGSKQTISIIRNSQEGLLGKKSVTYSKTDMTISEFSADMFTYIFEMIHFADWLQSTIDKNINKEQEVTDYGIDDILKDYTYTQSSKTYAITADLSPINKNLGSVHLNIVHDNDYKLTSLNGDIGLVSVIKAKIKLNLNTPTYGDATRFVKEKSLW